MKVVWSQNSSLKWLSVSAEVSVRREGWEHHWWQRGESETGSSSSAEKPHLLHKPQFHSGERTNAAEVWWRGKFWSYFVDIKNSRNFTSQKILSTHERLSYPIGMRCVIQDSKYLPKWVYLLVWFELTFTRGFKSCYFWSEGSDSLGLQLMIS